MNRAIANRPIADTLMTEPNPQSRYDQDDFKAHRILSRRLPDWAGRACHGERQLTAFGQSREPLR
ncbi:hypothetical protein MARHY0092 [Marinobacter nauticus ATCC 49840]|nr:hypothetical protein MARHY0092 [Marinobacter nauticus ATCC 49840]